MERKIQLSSEIDRTELFGNLDVNLDLIQEAADVEIIQRDDRLILKGDSDDALDMAEGLLGELSSILENGEKLDKQKVLYVISLSREGVSYRESKVNRDVICFTHNGRPLKPKTIGQKAYVDSIRSKDVVFGIGPAGTGKTYIAVAMAVNAYKNKEVQKIILARPAVEAGERLGFLPGDLQDKVDPYLRPLYDALYDVLGRDAALRLKEKEVIEVVPLAYMRGRTLDNAFIILDEAQNTTREQMKMFLTRLDFGSKIVITGDVTQIDLPADKVSGLKEAVRVLEGIEDIAICRLTASDVVRHALVQKIVAAYDKFEQDRAPFVPRNHTERGKNHGTPDRRHV